jgi:hypothetical protein
VLEAHALQGVVQFHVHAEVVGVELELVAGLDAAVFVDVQRQRGDGAVAGEAPVLVLRGAGVVGDHGLDGFGAVHGVLRCGFSVGVRGLGKFRGWG